MAAVAARRLGLETALFEQAPDFGRVGGGIALHSNGLRVLEWLGILGDFEPLLHPTRGARIETPDGVLLSLFDYATVSVPQARIAITLRADLQEHLLRAATAAGARPTFGRRCTGLATTRDGAVLEFAGGETYECDLVLAADGARSTVRAGLGLQGRRKSVGQGSLRGVVPHALSPRAMREVWLSDGRRFGTAPLPGNRTYFYCSVPLGEWTGLRAHALPAWIDSWRAELPAAAHLLGAVEDWDRVTYDELAEVQLNRWWRGPGIVIGDAAHAMTPDLGQGANSAMVDALVVMRLLAAGADAEQVGRRYERIRRGFVRRLQLASRVVGLMSTWSSAPSRLLRRVLLAPGRVPLLARPATLLAAGSNRGEESFLRR